MATVHIKQLGALKEKRRVLQEKEDKIKAEILTDLSTCLIDANALEVDFDILIGGILDVIKKAQQGDKVTEAWKLSGEKFRQRKKKSSKSRKNPNTPEKIEKDKANDQ